MKTVYKELVLCHSGKSIIRLAQDANGKVDMMVRYHPDFGPDQVFNSVANASQWHETLQLGIAQAKTLYPDVIFEQDWQVQRWHDVRPNNDVTTLQLSRSFMPATDWIVSRQAPGQPNQTLTAVAPTWEGAIEAVQANLESLTKMFPVKIP